MIKCTKDSKWSCLSRLTKMMTQVTGKFWGVVDREDPGRETLLNYIGDSFKNLDIEVVVMVDKNNNHSLDMILFVTKDTKDLFSLIAGTEHHPYSYFMDMYEDNDYLSLIATLHSDRFHEYGATEFLGGTLNQIVDTQLIKMYITEESSSKQSLTTYPISGNKYIAVKHLGLEFC